MNGSDPAGLSMGDVVVIVATVASAVTALASLLIAYLGNRPMVVVLLHAENDRYQVVVSNLSTTRAARDVVISVAHISEKPSSRWELFGIKRDFARRVPFLAPGETVPIAELSDELRDARLNEMLRLSLMRDHQSELVLTISKHTLASRLNPFYKNEVPLWMTYPRVMDERHRVAIEREAKA